ncbi:hypothetical protein F4861DRAFT_527430 [Xylaria intraflava]|nr:hypothetical protein F4861DRAFT_527430 [Xylaria intraflava]
MLVSHRQKILRWAKFLGAVSAGCPLFTLWFMNTVDRGRDGPFRYIYLNIDWVLNVRSHLGFFSCMDARCLIATIRLQCRTDVVLIRRAGCSKLLGRQ